MASAVSRAVIEVLLDRIHQGAGTLSPAGELIYSNQRLAAILGKPRAQLIGRPLADAIAEADRDTLAAALSAGRDSAARCALALPRNHGLGPLQAVFTFAPLGHGQASCLVTEVRDLLGTVRTSLQALKRGALEPDAQRALEALELQSGKVLELLDEQRRATPKE